MNILYNYFYGLAKLFLDLVKIVDSSTKLFFPCTDFNGLYIINHYLNFKSNVRRIDYDWSISYSLRLNVQIMSYYKKPIIFSLLDVVADKHSIRWRCMWIKIPIPADKFNFTYDDRQAVINISVPLRHVESENGKERNMWIYFPVYGEDG